MKYKNMRVPESQAKKVHVGFLKNEPYQSIYKDDFLWVYYIIKTESSNNYELYCHSNSGFEINIILNGKVVFGVEEANYFMSHNDVIVLSNGVQHSCYTIDETKITFLCIDFDFLRKPEDNEESKLFLGFDKLKNTCFSDKYDVARTVLQIIDIYKDNVAYKNEQIEHKIYDCFFGLLASFEEKAEMSSSQLVAAKIKNFIDINYDKKLVMKNLCELFNFSESSILKIFKKISGMSISSYYIYVKMDNAKRLLLSECYTINEISDMLGCYDVHYFCKLFKSRFGLSPTEYRKNYEANKKVK